MKRSCRSWRKSSAESVEAGVSPAKSGLASPKLGYQTQFGNRVFLLKLVSMFLLDPVNASGL